LDIIQKFKTIAIFIILGFTKNTSIMICRYILLNSHSAGGVQTGSTQHVGHFWLIVLDPGDCKDGEFGGMKIGRGTVLGLSYQHLTATGNNNRTTAVH
jgi:hypothetical protein